MSGIEYSALETPGGSINAPTYTISIRMKFSGLKIGDLISGKMPEGS
jgi:hypothetical protein